MAIKFKRQKTIHYKYAKINETGKTLQDYLMKALDDKAKPVDRFEILDAEGKVQRFINSKRKQNNMLFGQMIQYEEGKDPAIVIIDEAQSEFSIEHFPMPERADSSHQEFIESVLYFGILENHVLLLQGKGLKNREFEAHILWLLTECADILPNGIKVVISDKPSQEIAEKIDKRPVKKVFLGTDVFAPKEELEANSPSEKDDKSEETISLAAKKIKFSPFGRGAEILSAIFGDTWKQNLSMDDALDDSNLKVNLEISYLRKTTSQGRNVIDNIATAMRHHEDLDDVKIDFVDGGTMKGGEIRLSDKVSVYENNGIIDASDLYIVMQKWLEKQINNGNVV